VNILQAFKMAWKSIAGKKGRSALTILSIFIGIAAVMTIVSVMEGMKEEMMKQLNAMGSNRLTVYMYSWMYDADGNDISPDYFPDLYDYCQSMKETVVGVTPNRQANATVVYGTKNSANMETKYDEQWNLISGPPTIYFGSDQYSACSNLTLAKGRDLAYLDMQNYNQVCVIGAEAAKIFFGTVDPVGKEVKINGNKFTVVGVYAPRGEEGENSINQMDNIFVIPYTMTRLLGGSVRALVLRVALLNGVGRRVDEVFVRKHGVVVADAQQIAVGDLRAGIFEVKHLGERRDGEEHHAAADDGRAGVLLAGAVILHRAGGQVTVEHALPFVEDGDRYEYSKKQCR